MSAPDFGQEESRFTHLSTSPARMGNCSRVLKPAAAPGVGPQTPGGTMESISINMENDVQPGEHEITEDHGLGKRSSPCQPGGAMENTLDKAVSNIEREIERHAQAQLGADQIIPSYYRRRFDAIKDTNYPSIFKFSERSDAITVAAIGPYHRSAQPVITNAKKSRIVTYLTTHHKLDRRIFLRWVLDKEEMKRARSCYDIDSLGHMEDSEKFAEMLLLDGCLVLFAIFLLRSSVRDDKKPSIMVEADMDTNEKEFIHLSADISFHMKQLRLELLMLDNQIPFSVVVQLYNQLQTTLFHGVDAGSIEEIAVSCFDDIHPICNNDMKHPSFPKTVHHLLHLFHWSRSPSGKYNVQEADFIKKEPKSHLPSATELRGSAILFRKMPPRSSLDLSFHRNMFGMYGKMTIPTLYLSDHSELIFRSLIAFEQNHLRCGVGVTAFCICMARLLQSKTDAKLLRKNRILAHTNKTDQEIVDFFKKISGEYKETFTPKDLLELYKGVATHRESQQGKFMEELLLYFPNRWTTISIIVGAIALFLTLTNTLGTIHTVYRYYYPMRR